MGGFTRRQQQQQKEKKTSDAMRLSPSWTWDMDIVRRSRNESQMHSALTSYCRSIKGARRRAEQTRENAKNKRVMRKEIERER